MGLALRSWGAVVVLLLASAAFVQLPDLRGREGAGGEVQGGVSRECERDEEVDPGSAVKGSRSVGILNTASADLFIPCKLDIVPFSD